MLGVACTKPAHNRFCKVDVPSSCAISRDLLVSLHSFYYITEEVIHVGDATQRKINVSQLVHGV